ncbi:alpha/beta fold hydrolase [Allokutzneria sp. A3M-2-11 16]|uniref:alpha/beta fold hydrolase n=1 Tax=Allokutzneria sp. A3M-2-11 16 TaxID=2962043 RepID=UPI0020B75381|nr:alpha/beta hydrolase [Allokutzneria sp. A3M-2-11 16]MCP3803496.1 alpha/beta fold hydrolase [Allokutzneria sp. A3M-2-11 16]
MERMVRSNGITLWCEDFGDPADPAVLLVMGLGGQGTSWNESFCSALVEGGRYVVRFDSRDTGRSDSVDFTASPYTMTDMAADAVGVLDALGIGAAHVVGASMGGMVGQEMAIEHPARVLSLTSWMSSPDTVDPVTMDWRTLPGRRPEVVAIAAEMATSPPKSHAEHVDFMVRLARTVTGSGTEFDEDAVRRLVENDLQRAPSNNGTTNHSLAAAGSRDRRELLRGLTLPVLVLHGTEDPIVPFEHAEEMARLVPGARLVPLTGVGHEMPRARQGQIVEEILAHTG